MSTQALYLNLVKDCVSNMIYQDTDILRKSPFNDQLRREGRDWPSHGHTMIGLARLDNIQFCIENILASRTPGDVIEAGVWRGGATIFMRAILKAYNITNRCVWVADSFQGLPCPDISRYPQDEGALFHEYDDLAVSLEEVQDNFRRYGLLDKQVKFLKGWFRESLASAPINTLSVIRLDGDMYESTMTSLVALYPKLAPGGFLIVDDYSIPSCRQAVQDYRTANCITEPITAIDWTGVYWQRKSGQTFMSRLKERLWRPRITMGAA